MKKKIISFIVASLMVLQLFSGVVYADEPTEITREAIKLTLSDCSGKSSGVTGRNIAKGEWITFTVDVLETANYRFTAYSSFATGTYADISIDGESIFTKEYKQKYQSFGKTEILKGEHEIKISVTEGELKNFSHLKIACVDYIVNDKDMCHIEAEDYFSTTVSEYYHVDCQCTDYYSGSLYSNSGLIYLESTCNAVYNIVAESDGVYKLTMYASQSSKDSVPINIYNGERLAGVANVKKTSSFTLERPTVVENIALSKGSNMIKFENNSSGIRIFYMTVEKTGDGISLEGLFDAENNEIVSDSFVNRGNDVFRLEFSGDILSSSLSNKTITLTDSQGNELPLEFFADGNDAYVSLAETFKYNESYTITTEGIKDANGLLSTGKSVISFKTKSEDEDGGLAGVEITSQGNDKKKVIIKGIIKNAKETGIKGRKVSLMFDSETVCETVSEDGGRFVLEYTMPSVLEEGVYAFSVVGEYMDKPIDIIVDYQPDINTTEPDDEISDDEFPPESENARIFTLTLPDASDKSSGVTSESIPKDGWAEFEIDVEQAGNYRVITRAKYSDGTSVSLIIDDKVIFEKSLADKKTYQTFGMTELSEGTHTVRFNVGSGGITTLSHLRFVCTDYVIPSSGEYKIESEDYSKGNIDQTNHVDNQCTDYYSGSTISNAGCIYVDKTCEVSYNLIVHKDGIYRLTLYGSQSALDVAPIDIYNGEELCGYANIEKTSSFTLERATVVEEIPLYRGVNPIKLLNNSTGVRLFFMTVERVSDVISLEGVYDEKGSLLANGSKIARGNDVFKLEFNNTVSAESVRDGAISIKETDGKEVATVITTDENYVYVSCAQTLDYNKNYRMSVGSISDKNGWFSSKAKNYTFTTKDTNDDSGKCGLSILSQSNTYRNIKIEGIIKGSSGVGIKGRKVMLYLGEEEVAEVYSQENGKFILEYILPYDKLSGIYLFEVGGEYVENETEVYINYISEEDEARILVDLSKTKTKEDVKQLFNESKDVFGIDEENDMKYISNKDAVYSHLVGAEVKTSEDLKNLYYAYVTLETVNQAEETSIIDGVLKDAEKSSYLNLEFNKNTLIVNERNDFLEEINNMETISDIEKMSEKINAITEKYLAKEYKKEASVSAAEDSSVYAGQGVEISLDFEKYGANIKKIEYVVEVSDEDMADDFEVNLKAKAKAETKREGKVIYITVSFAEPVSDIEDIGSIMLCTPYGEGNYTVKVSGNVFYDENVGCDIIAPITEKTVFVTVSVNNSKPQSGGMASGGGSYSGGYSGGSASSGVVNTPQQSVTDETVFIDLGSVGWAYDAIKTLKQRGIISESDDGCFYPDRNVTREEFVKMLVCAMGLNTEGRKTNLKDLDSGAWYYGYIAAAEEEKLVTGDEYGNFNIGANITRQDMAVLIYRILLKKGFAEITGETYSDDGMISEYAKSAVYTLKAIGMMNGTGDNTFEPKTGATRAMAAKVIYEMIKVVEK